jgi:ferredoxin-NADP reductase
MMSIVRYLYDLRSQIDVVLLYSIKTLSDWTFRAEMQFISERHPFFHPRITLTRPQANEARFGLTGRINPAIVEMVSPDWSDRTVFVCGSDSFMTGVRQTFEVMEFPMERYHEESFGDSAAGSAPLSSSSMNEASVEHTEALDEVPTVLETLGDAAPSVNFVQSGKSIEADVGLSVLELAEQVGANIESSCCVGRCGVCKVKACGSIAYRTIQQGSVLTEPEKAAGYVLSCIAYPVGAVEIEA